MILESKSMLLVLEYVRMGDVQMHIIQQQKKMKKQKREVSYVSRSKQTKQNIESATPLTSKKILHPFKHNELHKENRPMAPQTLFLNKSSKKTCAKPKQRTKSLIFNKKNVEPLTQQSFRHTFFDVILKRPDKDYTNVSAHINSIRFDRPLPHADNFYDSFHLSRPQILNVFSEVREDANLMMIKQLQEENKSFQVNITALKSQMSHFIRESQSLKEQNSDLKHQISSFQFELQARACEYKAKEAQLMLSYKKQRKQFQENIDKLQSDLTILTRQKNKAQEIIKVHQSDITQLKRSNANLKEQWQNEHQQKQALKIENEKAAIRIISLEQQLENFSQSLSHFDKLKKTYESRVQQLQAQKKRIKKNASELLEMVQNCAKAQIDI